jgi:hypothetical protein
MTNLHALADALLSLAPGGLLTKEQRKGYVVLERKLSKSDRNKNAVSCIREGVSFMVPDWTMKSEAEREQLQFEESKRYRRLVFPDLTLSQIEVSSNFFTRLVSVSIKEAESLQSGKSH